MLKHQLYINLLVITSTLALTACADEVTSVLTPDTPTPAEGKTPIELTVGGVYRTDGVTTRASSSAVITEEETDMIPFPENTNIFMVMQSEYDTNNDDFNDPDYTGQNPAHKKKTTVARGTVTKDQTAVSFDDVNKRYWDDAHARSTQLTIWAFAQMYKTNWTQCKFQKVVNSSATDWSKFADQEYDTRSTTYNWRQDDVYPGIKEWNVTHNANGYHDETSILCQDLLFSNNIANNTNYNKGDNRLKFNTGSKRFPTDNKMYFRHALSKITIHIKKGEGFGDQFAFTTGNVKLSGFNRKGAFNIKEGEFQDIWDFEPIPQIYKHQSPNSGDAFTLEALAIPNINKFRQSQGADYHDDNSRFTSDGTSVMMEFTIEGNKYEITSKQLYNALHVGGDPNASAVKNAAVRTDYGTYIPLEAGKNYEFTLTIGKTKIENISATLAPWVNVVAVGQVPDNGYVKLELKDQTGNLEKGKPKFDFYLAKDPTTFSGNDYNTWAQYSWDTGYEQKTVTWDEINNCYETPVFWPDNRTFYHFRTINRGLGDVDTNKKITTTYNGKDYVIMYSGPIKDTPDTSPSDEQPDIDYSYTFSTSTTNGYNDYIWGAPFNRKYENDHGHTTAAVPGYSTTTGYCNASPNKDGQIYKAIGATKDVIFFYQFHMMSNIYVDLDNTNQGVAQDDLVKLENAKVKILRYAKSAKLQMGNGLVTGYDYNPTSPATETSVEMDSDIKAEETGTNPHPAYDYSYRMVPQPLKYTPTGGSETTVGIEITCMDGNVYKIPDISTITTTGSGGTAINYWMPGKNYYYKFTLKKSGIDKIQATVVDWEKIEAANEDVTIK